MADFDGGAVTSDAGAAVARAGGRGGWAGGRLAACFENHRDARFMEHSVRTLVHRRVFGIALGDEELIDHDVLRADPMMMVLAGKLPARRRKCTPVAGKSTLNCPELSGLSPSGDSKIVHDGSAIALLGMLFLDAHEEAPKLAGLDFDATDDPVHGSQEGRFFHGYYDCYCYLPLDVLYGARASRTNRRSSPCRRGRMRQGETAPVNTAGTVCRGDVSIRTMRGSASGAP